MVPPIACALFLEKGGHFLKNTSFMFKTEEEKTVKLITLLRQRSRDTLSGEQLNQLALAVKTGRQYTVCLLYTSFPTYRR